LTSSDSLAPRGNPSEAGQPLRYDLHTGFTFNRRPFGGFIMTIRVQCGCGKTLAAADNLAGKKAKCPKCGATVQLPAALAPAPAPTQTATSTKVAGGAARGAGCAAATATAPPKLARTPTYAEVMSSGIAGNKRAAAEAPDEPEEITALASLVRKLAIPAIVVVLLVVGLIGYLAYTSSSALDHAEEMFAMGDMSGLTANVKATDARGEDRERLAFLLNQATLELKKNTGDTLGGSLPVESDDVAITAEPPKRAGAGNVHSIRVTIKNTARQPLKLTKRSFYLRGGGDTVKAGMNDRPDTLREGAVVAPGESLQTTLIFSHIPVRGALKKNAFGVVDQFSLIYNDGERYVKVPLNY
jgi:phage FluMu protein Com